TSLMRKRKRGSSLLRPYSAGKRYSFGVLMNQAFWTRQYKRITGECGRKSVRSRSRDREGLFALLGECNRSHKRLCKQAKSQTGHQTPVSEHALSGPVARGVGANGQSVRAGRRSPALLNPFIVRGTTQGPSLVFRR